MAPLALTANEEKRNWPPVLTYTKFLPEPGYAEHVFKLLGHFKEPSHSENGMKGKLTAESSAF